MARSNCSASTHDVSSDNPLVYRVARERARSRLPQRLFAPSRLAGRAADDDDDAVLVIIIGLAVIITLVVVVVAVVWAREQIQRPERRPSSPRSSSSANLRTHRGGRHTLECVASLIIRFQTHRLGEAEMR